MSISKEEKERKYYNQKLIKEGFRNEIKKPHRTDRTDCIAVCAGICLGFILKDAAGIGALMHDTALGFMAEVLIIAASILIVKGVFRTLGKMKKKLMTLLALVFFAVCLGGCGNEIMDMSAQESEQISEYAAAVLLAYDKDYHSRLLNDEEIAMAEAAEEKERERQEAVERIAQTYLNPAEETGEESLEQNNGGSSDAAAEEKPVVMSDFLGLTGVDIRYTGNVVADSYPESGADGDELNTFFAMRASAGNKLLVLKFRMQNTSDGAYPVDVLSKKARFTVSGASFDKVSTQVTMLENDFSTFNATMEPGESTEVVLVSEIPEAQAADVGGLTLNMKYNGDSASLTLQ